jgi:ubiquinone/menaquinone biosynthesis C-methylase UbiE
MPDAYERHLVAPVFRPFAVDLARRLATYRPRRVLELAAGTGVVTAEILAALPDADVVATDLNEAMVDLGEARVPAARWRQADALDLPFEDGEFDAVVCQFGVMFFPDRARAYAEAHRVLQPGGRLILNTWDALDRHDFQAAVVTAIRRIFPDDPPTFLVAVPHGYADAAIAVAELRSAGFRDVTGETIALAGHSSSAADLAVGYCLGTPLRAEVEARGELTEVTSRVAAEVVALLGDGPVTGRMSAHVVVAQR